MCHHSLCHAPPFGHAACFQSSTTLRTEWPGQPSTWMHQDFVLRSQTSTGGCTLAASPMVSENPGRQSRSLDDYAGVGLEPRVGPKRRAEGSRRCVTQMPTQATEVAAKLLQKEILDHESPRPASNSIMFQRDSENSAKPGHSGWVSQVPGEAKAPRRWPCYNRRTARRSTRCEE